MLVMSSNAPYPDSGEAYRQARAARGLTQRTVADAAGLSPRHYIRIEGGENRPYPALRDRIAETLGVDPATLPAVGDAPFRPEEEESLDVLLSALVRRIVKQELRRVA